MYVMTSEYLYKGGLEQLIKDYGFERINFGLIYNIYSYENEEDETGVALTFSNGDNGIELEIEGYLTDSESCMEMLYRLVKDNVIEYVPPKAKDDEVE